MGYNLSKIPIWISIDHTRLNGGGAINMIKATCVGRIRDKNGNVTLYKLLDGRGNRHTVSAV